MPPAEPAARRNDPSGTAQRDDVAKAVLDFLARRAGFSCWWLSPYFTEINSEINDTVYMFKLQRGEDYTCLRRCAKNLVNWTPIIMFYTDRPDDVLCQLFKYSENVVAKFPTEQIVFLKGDETFDDILAQAEIERDLKVDKPAG